MITYVPVLYVLWGGRYIFWLRARRRAIEGDVSVKSHESSAVVLVGARLSTV